MKTKKIKNRQLGFTLLELLVVISIIGTLASIVLVSTVNARAQARDARRQADVQQIVKALYLYESKHNQFPGDPSLWHRSDYGDFLPELINEDLIAVKPKDPINDEYYFYGYTPSDGGVCPPNTRAVIKYNAERKAHPSYIPCFVNDPQRIGQCFCIV